jgi:hypothetical protein
MRARSHNKEVMSGKILSTCTVSIAGIGEHSATGEGWADENCAMTSADAQAFKRACSAFGLGRYTYDFEETWVDLDEYKQPKRLPQLPKWAVPGNAGDVGQTTQRSTATKEPNVADNQGMSAIDPCLIEEIERHRRELGKALYNEVIHKVGKSRDARAIASKELADAVLEWLQRAKRGIEKARDLGEQVSIGQYDHIFHHTGVENLSAVPSMAVLSQLVNELVKATSRAA